MYEVRYRKQAAHRLLRMARNTAQRIRAGIEAVATEPGADHPNATRLRGRERGFRLRVGDWRVLYSLDDDRKVLLVAQIDPRGQVYR